jgi:hypothetical protein
LEDLVERHFDRLGTLWEHWGGGEVKGDLEMGEGSWGRTKGEIKGGPPLGLGLLGANQRRRLMAALSG